MRGINIWRFLFVMFIINLAVGVTGLVRGDLAVALLTMYAWFLLCVVSLGIPTPSKEY